MTAYHTKTKHKRRPNTSKHSMVYYLEEMEDFTLERVQEAVSQVAELSFLRGNMFICICLLQVLQLSRTIPTRPTLLYCNFTEQKNGCCAPQHQKTNTMIPSISTCVSYDSSEIEMRSLVMLFICPNFVGLLLGFGNVPQKQPICLADHEDICRRGSFSRLVLL